MHIRCPHCQNAIEIVGDSDITDVTCPSCGSSFNLVPQTESFHSQTRTIGHFQLLEHVGTGAFGSVWKAKDTELDRLVAVKIPRNDQVTQEDAVLFLREARAAAQLKHPSIVAVHEVGRENGTLYIVSDFVQGVTLADRLTAGPYSVRDAADLCALLAEALHHAHEAGVIHRDLKPSNIMLDAEGQPHIMDFGLAKREAGEITMTVDGKVVGTAAYMSPEQARGEAHHVDRRTDVYSLGVILFELLTGERPFRGNRAMLLNQVLHEDAPSPRKLNGRIPRDLETICLKCLDKNPRRRYATAAEVGAELRRWFAGEAILARPISTSERGWRWARRNPRVAGLSAAVLLLLVAVASASSILAVMAQSQRRFAEQAAITQRNLRTAAEQAARRERDANTQLAQANKDLKESNALERAAKADADQKRIYAEQTRDEVNETFSNLLRAFSKTDPSTDGEKITVAELFGTAVEKLDTTFPNQPIIQAQVLNAVGLLYQNLGLYERAIAVLERARNLRRDELGEDHEHTLTSVTGLAHAYYFAGRRAEAIGLIEQTLKLTTAKIGPDRQETLSLMGSLASMYASEGRLAEALPIYEQTLELMKVKLGPEHPDTLTTMGGLVSVHWSAGRRDEALRLYEGMLKSMKGKFGPDHSNTLSAMDALARLYWSAARLQDALPLYEELVRLKKAKLGPFHHDTLSSMRTLSEAYRAAGRMQEGLALLEETLNLSKTKLGHDHEETLISMKFLALRYQEMGRQTEALALFEEALNLSKAKLGPDDPSTLAAMQRLAHAYTYAGKLDEALHLREHTLAGRKAKLGFDHPDTLDSMDDLAESYWAAGRLPGALTLCEDLLQLRKAKLGLDHFDTLHTMLSLAEIYLESKEPDKAIPLLTDWRARLRKHYAADNPNLISPMVHAGRCLLKHEEYVEAERILRECLASHERTHRDAWVTFDTQSLLGGALLGQKKYAEAEPMLAQGYEGMKQQESKIPGKSKTLYLTSALQRLVELYTAWERPEEAEKWQAILDESAAKP